MQLTAKIVESALATIHDPELHGFAHYALREHANGDLFELPVDSNVNSGQTDFVLNWDETTVSGQLKKRFGDSLQQELDTITNGRVLPAGTVLRSSGGGEYTAIFHVGFHGPGDWPDLSKEDAETEHISVVRDCCRQVLVALDAETEIRSVAFPLIGTGLFGLDPRLLAYEFAQEFVQFAAYQSSGRELDVWLAIDDRTLYESVLDPLVQAIIDECMPRRSGMSFCFDVPLLDSFQSSQLRSNDERWLSWATVRFAEVVLRYLFGHIANAVECAVTPESLLKPNSGVTFGGIRREALKVSHSAGENLQGWEGFVVSLIIEDADTVNRLKYLQPDRNPVAHGGIAPPMGTIWAELEAFVQPEMWNELSKDLGPPPEVAPNWFSYLDDQLVDSLNASGREVGLLGKWVAAQRRYVVSHTGIAFVKHDQ